MYQFFFTNNFLINEKLFTTSIAMEMISKIWAVVIQVLFLRWVIALVYYFLHGLLYV